MKVDVMRKTFSMWSSKIKEEKIVIRDEDENMTDEDDL